MSTIVNPNVTLQKDRVGDRSPLVIPDNVWNLIWCNMQPLARYEGDWPKDCMVVYDGRGCPIVLKKAKDGLFAE